MGDIDNDNIDSKYHVCYTHDAHHTQDVNHSHDTHNKHDAYKTLLMKLTCGGYNVNVYGYLRVSTETQVEKGYGLETQRQTIEAYAKENNLPIKEIFIDAGISGAIKDTDEGEALSKRQGLLNLLSAIGEDDKIIVLNTSRLWRSDNAKVLIRREIKKSKAHVISIEQPKYDIYATDPNDRLIAGIIELLDEWERLSIALKLAKGRTTKATAGNKPAGITPFGYMYSEDKKSVIVNEKEAQHVKIMFTEGQKGRTLAQISDTLTTKGALTRNGKTWSRGSIQAVLRNSFYTGILTHQGQEIPGNHEAIISKVQFGKVSKQLKSRRK